jgi:hypothetical protein
MRTFLHADVLNGQGLLLTVQFALKLHIGLLQFTDLLSVLLAIASPADDAKVRTPLRKMMGKQTPLTTPRVQGFVDQPVALMQSHQPLFQRPVFWTFCVSGVRAPTRRGATSHPLP